MENIKFKIKYLVSLLIVGLCIPIELFLIFIIVMAFIDKITSMAICGIVLAVVVAVVFVCCLKSVQKYKKLKTDDKCEKDSSITNNSIIDKKETSKNFKRAIVGGLIGIVVALGVIIVFSLPDSPKTDVSTTNNAAIHSETDPMLKLLMEECGVSKEEAARIKKDFIAVGIEDLEKIEGFEGAQVEGMKSFEYFSSKVTGTLIIKDGKTDYIDTGDIVLFDDEKSGAIDNVSRYYLSSKDESKYLYAAEELVKQNLKAPATAEFPNWYSGDWEIYRVDDVVTVVSYVDSQNSFGAMIRGEFGIQYSYPAGNLLYFEFDNQVIYGTVQNVE